MSREIAVLMINPSRAHLVLPGSYLMLHSPKKTRHSSYVAPRYIQGLHVVRLNTASCQVRQKATKICNARFNSKGQDTPSLTRLLKG